MRRGEREREEEATVDMSVLALQLIFGKSVPSSVFLIQSELIQGCQSRHMDHNIQYNTLVKKIYIYIIPLLIRAVWLSLAPAAE